MSIFSCTLKVGGGIGCGVRTGLGYCCGLCGSGCGCSCGFSGGRQAERRGGWRGREIGQGLWSFSDRKYSILYYMLIVTILLNFNFHNIKINT